MRTAACKSPISRILGGASIFFVTAGIHTMKSVEGLGDVLAARLAPNGAKRNHANRIWVLATAVVLYMTWSTVCKSLIESHYDRH